MLRLSPATFAIAIIGAVVDLGSASADGGFQLDPLEILPGQGTALLDQGTSRILDHGRVSVGTFSSYQYSPLTAVASGERGQVLSRLVEHRVTTGLQIAVGLFNLLEVGLAMDAVPFQSSDGFDGLGMAGRAVPQAGIGDLRLVLRGRIFGPAPGQRGFGLHVTLPIAFPTGDPAAFLSDGTVRARPTVGLDYRAGTLSAGVNAGWEFRPRRELLGYLSDDTLHWGVWGNVEAARRALDVSVIARGVVTTAPSSSSGQAGVGRTATVELLGVLGFRLGEWLLQVGGAAAARRGVGTPDGRAFLGLSFAPEPLLDTDGDGIPDVHDACIRAPEDFDGFQDHDGCPDLDNDGDGIPDDRDQCPNEPEIFNGYQDEDGCPEPDADGDGIIDLFDKCPREPEDLDGYQDADGCPDPDNDGDGIPDTVDQCPNEPEDFDGFQDADGCPDPDNDGDGIPDERDQCPNEPENLDGIQDDDGCPEVDTDGDGIPDVLDRCPLLPETVNAFRDDDGCPDTRNPFISDFGFEIKTIRTIFFSYDNARVRPESVRYVDAIASVLRENPWITKLRIEGHTDSEGPAELNLALSEQRARVVRDALVQRGIAPERLVYVGLGEQFPLASNATPMGRIRNRRIEFHIGAIHGKSAPEPKRARVLPPDGAP